MKKLRLLITDKCNRKCPGCCNNDWDLNKPPKCKSFKGYDEIILTGGEPLLLDYMMLKVIYWNIMETANKKVKIYLYTAYTKNITKFCNILFELLDGITLTLHEQKDVPGFIKLDKRLRKVTNLFDARSMRLKVFKGVDLTDIDLSGWKVQKDMVWVKDCPLPKDEIFMRI
jgi:hypothetical protein